MWNKGKDLSIITKDNVALYMIIIFVRSLMVNIATYSNGCSKDPGCLMLVPFL